MVRLNQMSDGANVDRRFDQTRHAYAANDLEVIEEARRYSDFIFSIFKPFIGRRVLTIALSDAEALSKVPGASLINVSKLGNTRPG